MRARLTYTLLLAALVLTVIQIDSAAAQANRAPLGWIDEVSSPYANTLYLRGWYRDPDSRNLVSPLRIALDGTVLDLDLLRSRSRLFETGEDRPDVPTFHGFVYLLRGVDPGAHRLCVVALHSAAEGPAGPAGNLGCREVTVANPERAPAGVVDEVAVETAISNFDGAAGHVRLRGWVFDRDGPSDIAVLRGRLLPAASDRRPEPTTLPRPDVAAVLPGAGPGTGFDFTYVHGYQYNNWICVVALNIGPGVDRLLDCRSLPPSFPPPWTIGFLDVMQATGPGTARIAGWGGMLDDTGLLARNRVVVQLDHRADLTFALGINDLVRPDVAAAKQTVRAAIFWSLPPSNAVGFDSVLTGLPSGRHQLCVLFQLDAPAPALAPQLGACRTLDIA